MSWYKVFFFFLILRISSVFIVKTWFVPDEYWQSLEVAHKFTFGYGYLTWEWTKGIRSYLHPMIIVLIYKVLEVLKLDQVNILILAPRIAQALFTSYSDYRFYKWCGQTKWSIFMLTTSWFIFYTGSRTLINTFEMSLTVIALSFFPWKTDSNGFLWIVSLITFIRPTAAIPWIPLCIYHVKKSKAGALQLLFKRYLLIGITVAGLTIALDSYAHGSFIVTPFEFFKVNVINEIGSFYGIHSWNWYFIIGLPTTLGITVFPFILAAIKAFANRQTFPEQNVLLSSIFLTLVVLSLLPHKEFRFVLPLVPMCLYITSDYLTRWSRKASNLLLWVVAFLLFVGNIFPAVYISTVHQKGTLDVMSHLARIANEYKNENVNPVKILYLMPCHSTPYYSHIHANVTMRFLTCNPNFAKANDYVDEADEFYKDPSTWVHKYLPVYPRSALPTHLVLFDNLVPRIESFLTNYKPITTLFHSDIATDRVGKNVMIYERFDVTELKVEQPQLITPPEYADELTDNDDEVV